GQAWHGAFGSCSTQSASHLGGEDGRCPRGARRGRLRTCSAHWHLRGGSPEPVIRGGESAPYDTFVLAELVRSTRVGRGLSVRDAARSSRRIAGTHRSGVGQGRGFRSFGRQSGG